MSQSAPKRLDFPVVGVQKSGTTALSAKLAHHPGISCALPKELHIFDNESCDWNSKIVPDVAKHFPTGTEDLLWGEATPIYTCWPQAIERVARYNPDAKIIVGLRHPAYRALSHWKMEVTRHAECLSFSDAISEKGRARVNPVHRTFSYVEQGFYAPQVVRVLNSFPRQNVTLYKMDELYRNEGKVLGEMYSFLGLADEVVQTGPKYVVPVDTSGIHVDAVDKLAYLSDLYSSDILETERLTSLVLKPWLDGTYEESFLNRGCP